MEKVFNDINKKINSGTRMSDFRVSLLFSGKHTQLILLKTIYFIVFLTENCDRIEGFKKTFSEAGRYIGYVINRAEYISPYYLRDLLGQTCPFPVPQSPLNISPQMMFIKCFGEVMMKWVEASRINNFPDSLS